MKNPSLCTPRRSFSEHRFAEKQKIKCLHYFLCFLKSNHENTPAYEIIIRNSELEKKITDFVKRSCFYCGEPYRENRIMERTKCTQHGHYKRMEISQENGNKSTNFRNDCGSFRVHALSMDSRQDPSSFSKVTMQVWPSAFVADTAMFQDIVPTLIMQMRIGQQSSSVAVKIAHGKIHLLC